MPDYVIKYALPHIPCDDIVAHYDNEPCSLEQLHTWRPIIFIQPGGQDMSIIICAYKLAI